MNLEFIDKGRRMSKQGVSKRRRKLAITENHIFSTVNKRLPKNSPEFKTKSKLSLKKPLKFSRKVIEIFDV